MSRHYIRKREGPQGTTWYATVELSRDPKTGKRRQKHVSAATRKACEAEIARLLERDRSGDQVTPSRITVGELFDQWLAAVKPTVREASYITYRTWTTRIRPFIGELPLSRLSPLHVQSMMSALLEEGLSPTTVKQIYAILNMALKQAVRWGLIHRNVCQAVDPPRISKMEMVTWNRSEVMQVLAVAADDDLEALWRLALTTGMRRGELLGLRWIDVDLQRGVLAVRHTIVQGDHGRMVSSTPKSASGQRSIAIGAGDVDALIRHRDRQRIERTPNPLGLVFITQTGRSINPKTLAARFDDLTARAGVRRIRFHDMRHTCATLLLEADVHPKVVQERLGHSSISMTLDRYSHVSESVQQAAAERLNELLKVGA
jgi:integrase